jgi:dTDP-4-amino-4,6-dideoxygalactose transaminase
MQIERYDYAADIGPDSEALFADIRDMVLEGRYILSREVREFEEAYAAYLGARHVRGVNTGLDALIIALLALGVGPGDEVITQANTFYATVAAIRLVGARPVLVDADPASFLMDAKAVEAAITPRTCVLLPVHLYGKPTPMAPLLEIAARRGLAVVEDTAQAHGARIDGRRAGTFGNIGCFSFHPSKNLAAAGDGGGLVTNDAALDEAIRRRRELGQCGQNNHVVVALNSKLDAIQARILSWKLEHLDAWNACRRAVAERYRSLLADLPVGFQSTSPGEEHVYHLFQVRTALRDGLLEHLRRHGIDAVVRYPTPIHLQEAFADCGFRKGQFPVAESLARELLCLPVRPSMSGQEIEYVAETMRSYFRGTGCPS